MNEENCPCQSGLSYNDCCGPYHSGAREPLTALELLRSRYSAYAKQEIEYLRKTLVPVEQSSFDAKTTRSWAAESEWLGLEILRSEDGRDTDRQGVIEFLAKYRKKGEVETILHRELSLFLRLKKSWYFARGRIVGDSEFTNTAPIIGRSEPCPCGSKKKFKKCCAG
jgi:SEC-C motif domain protein